MIAHTGPETQRTASDRYDQGTPRGYKRWLRRPTSQYWIAPILLFVLLLPLLYFEGFHVLSLASSLVKTAAAFTLLALGASVVIATSNIDLSSIGVASMSGVLFALILSSVHVSHSLAILIAAAGSLAFAACSGLLVSFCFLRLKSPLLIFTWALGAIYNVITILIARLAPHSDVSGVALPWRPPNDMWAFGHIGFWLSALITAVAIIAMSLINLPQRAQAIGASETSAAFIGISRNRTLTECFVLNSLLACAAGILHSLYLEQASTSDLPGKELIPIAIAVLGGTALSGGYMSAWSVTAASLFWAATRLLGPHLPQLLPFLSPIAAEVGQILFYSIFLIISLCFGALLAPRFSKIYAQREA